MNWGRLLNIGQAIAPIARRIAEAVRRGRKRHASGERPERPNRTKTSAVIEGSIRRNNRRDNATRG